MMEAFVALLDSNILGPINIASGYSISVKELIYKVANQLGKPELVKLGAIPLMENEPLFIGANTKRLQDELHWSPKFSLDTGLEQTISWWKLNGV